MTKYTEEIVKIAGSYKWFDEAGNFVRDFTDEEKQKYQNRLKVSMGIPKDDK